MVIPALDEELRLPLLLARLQQGPPEDRADQVIVADGGSRDRTCELAQAGGATLVHAPRGRGSQLRAGAARAECEVLLFLHADCTPLPGALAALRLAYASGLQWGAMRQQVEAPGGFFRAVERGSDLRVRLLGLVYGDAALSVRRELYLRAGGFADLPLFEDVDLSRRLGRWARPRLVPGARVAVSARRWQREGRLRATARNWMLVGLYAAGVAPRRLARWYRPQGHDSRQA